jgi:predicted ATP-grasp superfamily ATP-dependent carboligase
MAEQPLIIVGASARAAAFSALRAGLRPWCIDLFADADLRAVCPVTPIDLRSYPNGFAELMRKAPDGPWICTGGLENHPKLVERIAAERPLWGNRGEVLRAVRSPVRVMQALRAAGLACPESRLEPPEPASTKNWLEKPLAGAGGNGIRFYQPKSARGSRRTYYQEFVSGLSASAVYVGVANRATLLGVTQQLIGEPWLNAKPFHYCGSVGPLALSEGLRRGFERIGNALVREFGLCGLFGVDVVIRDDIPYPVEVNPRYTASMEVLEYATGNQVMEWHRRAFEESKDPFTFRAQQPCTVGKAIIFASRTFAFPPEGPWIDSEPCLDRQPAYADIPKAGTSIESDWPVLTMFAQGPTANGVLEQLQQRANEMTSFTFRAREAPRET